MSAQPDPVDSNNSFDIASLTDDDLDELIDYVVAGQLDASDHGDLGLFHMERFERQSRPTDLDLAIHHLETALAEPPSAVDGANWRYNLAVCYSGRAFRTRDDTDWTRTVELYCRLREDFPPGSAECDEVLCELAESHYHRYLDQPADRPDELLATLHDSRDNCHAQSARARIGIFVVLTWHLADVIMTDEDIAWASSVVHDAPDGSTLLVGACYALSEAYITRYVDTSLPADLDGALIVLARAFAVADPADPESFLLYENEAICRRERWRLVEDPVDRDRAIDCFARMMSDERTTWRYDAQLGDLLRQRGAERADLADLDRAVDVLTDAAERVPEEGEDAWEVRFWLGEAHNGRWDLSQDPADLLPWTQCFRKALAQGITDPDSALWACLYLAFGDNQWLGSLTDDALRDACATTRSDLAQVYRHVAVDPDPDCDLCLFVAAIAATLEMYLFSLDLGEMDFDRIAHHVERAYRITAEIDGLRAMLVGLSGLLGGYRGAMTDGEPDFGRAELVEAINGSGFGEENQNHGFGALAVAQLMSASRTGDRAARADARRLFGMADMTAPDDLAMVSFADLLTVLDESLDDQQAVVSAVDATLSAVMRLPDTYPARPFMLTMVASFARLYRSEPPQIELAAMSPTVGEYGTMLGQLTSIFQVMPTMIDAILREDPPGVIAAVTQLERLATIQLTGQAHQACRALLTVGYGRLATGPLSSPQIIESAIHWADEVFASLLGPEHPLQTILGLTFSRTLRMRDAPGDRARSRSVGMDVLRSRAWSALLQSGTEEAMAAVREAAEEAQLVAGWCAQDSSFDELVLALDAGRGLVLHAATTARTVADQLTALGRADLAAEWSRTGGTGSADLNGPWAGGSIAVSGDLRHRVLRVLAGEDDPVSGSLLDPPDTAAIRQALLAHGSDALVYLVPGGAETTGMAVLVPARGTVFVVPMPDLRTDPGSPVERYTRAYARQHGPDGGGAEARADWRSALDDVIDWAWRSAGAELLAAAADRLDATGLPRLVLVPVGTLAVVPWHAARRVRDGGVRYLAEDAVVSYTPSARMLCDAVARPAARTGASLVVGNPTGDLVSAGAEARAVHEAFYRDGGYLGQGARQGPGSPDEVLDWLADHTERQTLHLACHARAEPAAPIRSRIVLADRAPLLVSSLLDRAPTQRMALERVFLAACTTNVSGAEHDEAFSIATAFLAVGARTAFGSLWNVPDGHTSLLMFMVHHYLNVERRAPADALHLAQLWMLDPRRTPPDTMPDELILHAGPSAAPNEPVSWAGFTHLGA